MKITLLSFVAFTLVLTAHGLTAAQSGINQKDQHGQKQGYWIITGSMKPEEGFEANSKIEEGNYENDLRQGIWKKYWKDGKLRAEITYEKGKPQGWYRTFYPSGNIEEEGSWWNNRNTGYLNRWNPNGKPQQMFLFNPDGKREGNQRYFHDNGQLEMEVFISDGKESGICRRYDDQGNLIEEKNFQNGELVPGSLKVYKKEKKPATHKDDYDPTVGTPSKIANDTTNPATPFLPNGFNTLYNKNGQVSYIGEFKNGRLYEGKMYEYDASGLLVGVHIFQNGLRIGNGILEN